MSHRLPELASLIHVDRTKYIEAWQATRVFLTIAIAVLLAFQTNLSNAYTEIQETEARADLANDTKILRKYAFWCANNPQLALKLGRCDSDNDGISNKMETSQFHTSPTFPDTDGDGRSDRSEVLQGTDPLVAENDGGCYPLYFYPKSKLTNKFNIPEGSIGSIPRGAALFKQLSALNPLINSVQGTEHNFLTLRALLKKPPFNFKLQGNSPTITTAQIADLVAYINRDKLNKSTCNIDPGNPSNSPTPTPTPISTANQAPTATATREATRTPTPAPTLSKYQWGYVYSSICSDCHTLNFQKSNRSSGTITNAVTNNPVMQGALVADTTPPFKTQQQKISDLVFYLNCLVVGGDDCR